MNDEEIIDYLEKSLAIFDDEIIRKFKNDKNGWELTVKRANYIFLINHAVGKEYCSIVFPYRLDGEELLTSVNKLWKDSQFRITMISTMTSPITSFTTFRENDEFHGFAIINRIFPYSKPPSLKELDNAIKSVVSIGALTANFINAHLGEMKIQSEVAEEPPRIISDDRMFQ